MQLILEALLLTGLIVAIATTSDLMRQVSTALNPLAVPVAATVRIRS